jgi:hypothetical protein
MASKLSPLFVLPIVAFAATAASAADMVVVMPPDEVAPVNYMSIEGGPLWNNGGFDASADKYGDVDDEEGFYVAATYRRLFKPEWDWQVTATGTWVDTSSSGSAGDFESDLKFQTIDFDFGFHPGGNPLNRFLIGIRALHLNDELSLTSGGATYGTYESEGWAFGPRAGFQTETMLGGSQFGFVAEGSGSVLFGSFDKDYFDSIGDPPSTSSDDNETIYNLEALAGLSWHATSQFTLTAGYRVQKWWNFRSGATATDSDLPEVYTISADEDPLFHGPFLRAATTF